MGRVSRRLQPGDPVAVAAADARRRAGSGSTADVKLLVRHSLAVLRQRAPGQAVEVRVPPYAAVQVVEGVRHTRGTPPAVVEVDAETWLDLATGALAWPDAVASGRVRASGERTDLAAYLPLLERS